MAGYKLPKIISEGGRNDELTRAAGALRRDGLDEFTINAALQAANLGRCKPPLPESEVRKIAASVSRYEPATPPSKARHGKPDAVGGLRRVKLGELMRDGIPPVEWLIEGLFYKSGVHWIYGPPGTGKSIIALWAALETIGRGKHVIYLDEENSVNSQAGRLAAMGADPDTVDEYFHWFPNPNLVVKDADLMQDFHDTLDAVDPALVVFDSLIDYLANNGASENDPTDVKQVMGKLVEPVKHRGRAALVLDHVPAESDDRIRGTTAKKGALDVMFKLRLREEFDRSTMGAVQLFRGKADKDRDGATMKRVNFDVGGDGRGNLICRRHAVDDLTGTDIPDLSHNASKALSALDRAGMRHADWKRAAVDAGVPAGSFSKAVAELLDRGLVLKEDGTYHLEYAQPELDDAA